MEREIKKVKAVQHHLDVVVQSIEEALLIPDLKERRVFLKGVVHYWLGHLFAEGMSHAGDLEVVNEVSKKIIERLKREKEVLLKRISQSR